MNPLHYFFHWYDGAIWSNLLASLIWAIPAAAYGRFHVKKLHRKLDEQNAKLKLIHKHIKETRDT